MDYLWLGSQTHDVSNQVLCVKTVRVSKSTLTETSLHLEYAFQAQICCCCFTHEQQMTPCLLQAH